MVKQFQWVTPSLIVGFQVLESGPICISNVRSSGHDEAAISWPSTSLLPMHQLRLAGEGNFNMAKSSKAMVSTYVSTRLHYTGHRQYEEAGVSYCEIDTKDSDSLMRVSSKLSVYPSSPVLRAETTVHNDSEATATITSLPSLVIGGLTRGSEEWWHDFKLSDATNSWFREAMWRQHHLSDIGLGLCGIWRPPGGCPASFATYSLSNLGSFSTGSYLPMGALHNKVSSETWAWQLEHNGSWKWEVGDWEGNIYLAAGGPNSNDHHCKHRLAPGGSACSVPVALCHVAGGPTTAFQAMTTYRRSMRRYHLDNQEMPIIFNDYMNCLMGDPTEDKVSALIEPAVRMGCDIFVIDAGWYADDGNWWDDIGVWEPSKSRFPSGLQQLTAKIKKKGLIPGAWLEPESIGVKSTMASTLPDEAFFQEDGRRIIERDRYQLDFRHPSVIEHLNNVIDRLVNQYHFRYFKFDYNIEIIQGTDTGGENPGAAFLAHNRAYLRWVSTLFDKYPGLVIESCSSGAQRMDYAMLSVHPIQSTSDQEDPAMYAPIAAALPTAVAPEQSATWAYPQPGWSDEINALTVINSMLGRFYLSGHIAELSKHQFKLVQEGVRVFKSIRADIRTGVPFWPLGLPGWHDDWVALGLMSEDHAYLSVWRRGGKTSCDIPLADLPREKWESMSLDLLYPTHFERDCDVTRSQTPGQPGSFTLRFHGLPDTACARFFQLY